MELWLEEWWDVDGAGLAVHSSPYLLYIIRSLVDQDQRVLSEPEWQGKLTEVDLRALTPLKWQHINPYGTFTLNMKERLSLDK